MPFIPQSSFETKTSGRVRLACMVDFQVIIAYAQHHVNDFTINSG
jgi:hypothetical protein